MSEVITPTLGATYSASEMMAIIGGLGVVITAIGVAVVNIIVALRSSAKLGAVIEKTDKLSGQVEQVHTLTNSNLSAVKAELTSAVREIVSMREIISYLKAERDKVATVQASPPANQEAAAASDVAVQKEHAGIAREQLEVQKKIEENTAPAKVVEKKA